MGNNRFKKVSKEEAEYKVTLALLPFLLENGTPVYIRRDGWTRSIQRDDGVIFIVDLGRIQRRGVQVVL